MDCERVELEAAYRRYLQRCDEHRFDELGGFVDENVAVNVEIQGLRGYAEELAQSSRRSRSTAGTCGGACWSTAAG
jgi:predicted ester cyclase